MPLIKMILEDEKLSLAAFQQRLRETVELSGGIKSLSDTSGIPYSTLQKYLAKNGSKEPSRKNITLIAIATGTSSDWLLTGVGSPKQIKLISLPRLEGSSDTVCVPYYSEDIYRSKQRDLFDVSDRSEIFRQSYSEMLGRSYRYLTVQEAYELFGDKADRIFAFSLRDVACGNELPDAGTIYAQVDKSAPQGGDLVIIDHINSLYLTKATIIGTSTRLVGFSDHPEIDLDYNEADQHNQVIGKVLAYTVTPRKR